MIVLLKVTADIYIYIYIYIHIYFIFKNFSRLNTVLRTLLEMK